MSFTVPVCNFSKTTTTYRPTASNNTYSGTNSVVLNPAYAYDKSTSTFAQVNCATSGSANLVMSGFDPFVTKSAVLTVNYDWVLLGGGVAAPKINYSTDGGLTISSNAMTGTTQTFSLADGIIASQVIVTISIQEKTGTVGLATNANIYDVNITQ